MIRKIVQKSGILFVLCAMLAILDHKILQQDVPMFLWMYMLVGMVIHLMPTKIEHQI